MAVLKVVGAVFAYHAVMTIQGCGGGTPEDGTPEPEEGKMFGPCTPEDGTPEPCTQADCCAGCIEAKDNTEGLDDEKRVIKVNGKDDCSWDDRDGGRECRLNDDRGHCMPGRAPAPAHWCENTFIEGSDPCTPGDCCEGCNAKEDGARVPRCVNTPVDGVSCMYQANVNDEPTEKCVFLPCTPEDGADFCTLGDCCAGCNAAGDDNIAVNGTDDCSFNGNECRTTNTHCKHDDGR